VLNGAQTIAVRNMKYALSIIIVKNIAYTGCIRMFLQLMF